MKWAGIFLLLLVGVSATPDQIIDCLTDHSNSECYQFYNETIRSCFDYVLSGHRTSGLYWFLKGTNGLRQTQLIRCDFDENVDDVVTTVHNALEQYNVQGGHGFQLVRPGGSDNAWHIDYELDHERVGMLEKASAACFQELRFHDCASFENLKAALKNRSAILLSADGTNLTEKDLTGSCTSGNSYHALNLTTAIVSLGSKARPDGSGRVQLSLGPLYCRGQSVKNQDRCNYDFSGDETIEIMDSTSGEDDSIMFNFRTLSHKSPLVNLRMQFNQWINISVEKGWFLRIPGFVEEALAPSQISDGLWHRLHLQQRGFEIVVNIDSLILVRKMANVPKFVSLHFSPNSDFCVRDLKINEHCDHKENMVSNRKHQSLCESRICNPDGSEPCSPSSDCLCRCADGKAECPKKSANTATFPDLPQYSHEDQSQADDKTAFVSVDGSASGFLSSFHFRTRKPTGLLAYLVKPEQFAQINIRDGSLEAWFCHINDSQAPAKPPEPSCTWCSIRKVNDFHDFSWHHVTFEERTPTGHSQAYLLTSSGACHLRPILSSSTRGKLYVIKPNGASQSLTFFGSVPDARHLKKGSPLIQTITHRGPPPFVGCMSYPNLKSHLVTTSQQVYDVSYAAVSGCSVPDPCSTCGNGIPCVVHNQDANCNCSSKFWVQDDLERPNQCRPPRPVKASRADECIASADVQVQVPHRQNADLSLDFSLLWLNFRVIAPITGKSASINALMQKHRILTIDFQQSINFQLTGQPGRITLGMPPLFLNSSLGHLFVLRRLSKDTAEVQVDNKRHVLQKTAGSTDHDIGWLDHGFVFDFAHSLCVSYFGVQFRNQDSKPPLIIEVDNLFHNVTGTAYPASVADVSKLEIDLSSLLLKDTPYPPKPKEKTEELSLKRGSFQYWIIGVIAGVILLAIIILGLVIYCVRFRRRGGRRAIPSVDLDDRRRDPDSDDETTEPKRLATVPFGLAKTKNENRNVPSGSSSVASPSGFPKIANERRVYQPLLQPHSPRARMPMIDDEDETGSLPSLNYSLSLDDPSLTLTLDSPISDANHPFAYQMPNAKAALCKFNEFSEIL